ncbi:lyase family protein [Pelagibius sp. Alg239-R121]|uniref:lyase family protein n=1 Tax=Pelagibius sp. Alg239-R121 TaxID=2993448 RepID=UPI0024A6D272|nr:lyase family protein [Pelagibius sp. Alg239-R121]
MLDWALYRDSFSTSDMRRIWSESETVSTWVRVEQVLARCQAQEGLIPTVAADTIEAISAAQIDRSRLAEDMSVVGRPIVGLVNQMRSLAGSEQGSYVHYLATTQDIMDTALSLQMKQSTDAIQIQLNRVMDRLEQLAEANAVTRMMGRTNGQFALPISLGTKLRVWMSELKRRKAALEDSAARGLLVQMGGPVGDLSRYEGNTGLAVKQAVAATLGLQIADPHWQNARDAVADIVTSLGSLCASLCKISHNINLLSSSDIGEICEGYEIGKGASSSMLHKKNQRASEFGEAVARLGRQRSEQIGELTLHQHERSGGVWIAEWLVVPETFLFTSGALMWTGHLFDSLEVNTEAMAEAVTRHEKALRSE